MHFSPARTRILAVALLCLAPLAARAADAQEIAELSRAIDVLRAENRAMAQRLAVLEAERAGAAAPAVERRIEQRVKELEIAKTAQEDAVRSIVRDSLSGFGSKINEAVSMSGTLEFEAGRSREFSGERKSGLGLSGLNLEFEVQLNRWALGVIKLDSVSSKDTLFTTSTGRQTGIDRIAIDTAHITLGDPQRFPVSLVAGRMVLPFGISTGRPVADVLSAGSPLTVEAFELRANALALNFAFPTPALTPPTPPVVAPPVRSLVLYPLVSAFGSLLGYDPPPERLKPVSPVSFTPSPPPFNAGVLVFEGVTAGGIGRHVGATVGYQTKGHCGKPYDQLSGSGLCPWAVNVDVNYNSSIFNSRFLETEYRDFLDQIGRVPALAASVKAALGPYALVAEWNGATRRAHFVDDAGRAVGIQPAAWQVSIGRQFDWNPWVEEIGAQGTFVSVSYSQSRDLAGVTRLLDATPSRVGTVPKRRLLLTAGEWVADGLRVMFELSRNWDYALIEGGSGKSATGITATLTYVW